MKNLNVTRLKEQIKFSKILKIALLGAEYTNNGEREYKIEIYYYEFPNEKPFISLLLITEDITTTKQYNLSELKECVEEVNRFNLTGTIY